MLTLSQLLALTSNFRNTFKTKYRIEGIQTANGDDTVGDFISFYGLITGGKEPRKSYIRLYGDDISVDHPCKVSCTCDYFKIKLALSLYQRGSTELVVKQQDLPKKALGIQEPGLCPHLLHLAENLLYSNNSEMRRARREVNSTRVSDKLRRLT